MKDFSEIPLRLSNVIFMRYFFTVHGETKYRFETRQLLRNPIPRVRDIVVP